MLEFGSAGLIVEDTGASEGLEGIGDSDGASDWAALEFVDHGGFASLKLVKLINTEDEVFLLGPAALSGGTVHADNLIRAFKSIVVSDSLVVCAWLGGNVVLLDIAEGVV